MQVSKEEIIHMAKLASLNLSQEEIEKYTNDMVDILNFANTVNNIDTEGINENDALNENFNVFRKDEVKQFEDKDLLLKNAPSKDLGMFKIPKVIG